MEQDLIIILIICSISVVSGILLHNLKMYSLLTDYKNMPPEAKNSIDWHSYTPFLFLCFIIFGLFNKGLFSNQLLFICCVYCCN